ncbi:dipicolinate synthase subunit DpsA [Candidatus Contubernalis alkaliaceticus]|uniref:dipicolinate synthase subunit DpsA n=1 Tax=Candidatus Contubernalis alkaliaceticus TaxID=338645 RepID=UPI001F4C032F|nr:dipicolinate synthase subunit DpsA [Candidatus Contubernalis alkalaceticus]UNC91851.1 dipicolinate synthase subunit DpsA [Candidatus Contubernalis alkalaceticus]
MSIKVTILGGDDREIEVALKLEELGFQVRTVGFDNYSGKFPFKNMDIEEAVSSAQVIIAPLAGTDYKGKLYARHTAKDIFLTEEILIQVKTGVLFLIGRAKGIIKDVLEAKGVKVVEVGDLDEIAILNSIPTAEGAIQFAMENTPITIHHSHSLVIGFGRCGITLARTLHALGARVTVAARNGAALARAWEMGFESIHLRELDNKLNSYEIIFNTVPVMILNREKIEKINLETLIIDIASLPGGVDFEAAREKGIKAILTLSLPGLVAPKTAGRMLAGIYPRLIQKYLY